MTEERHGHNDHRAVVTGMGIVTPIGDNLVDYLDSLVAGRSGISHWKRMDRHQYSKIGGDMSDFDLQTHLARVDVDYPSELNRKVRKLLRTTPLSGRLTAASALQAFVDAGLPDFDFDPYRTGHVLAGHNLNAHYIYENVLTYSEEPEYIEPLFSLMIFDTDVLAVICELLTLKGPSFSVGNACASGNLGLLMGLDLIRSGRADIVVVSGAPLVVDPVMVQGFVMIDAIAFQSFNDEPNRASRPFDGRREGFVPSDGAGSIVLESLSSARNRGARIRAELLGGSSVSQASRLTKPELEGQVRSMRDALRDAQVNPEEIDYINAHATSTPLGDAIEVAAIKTVLGKHAYRIPVNSTKSMLGHCLTAAGVVELIATILQMENNVVHPTINQEEKDPKLDLDFVPNEGRQHQIDIAMSNSFGFGGLNSTIVVGRAQ